MGFTNFTHPDNRVEGFHVSLFGYTTNLYNDAAIEDIFNPAFTEGEGEDSVCTFDVYAYYTSGWTSSNTNREAGVEVDLGDVTRTCTMIRVRYHNDYEHRSNSGESPPPGSSRSMNFLLQGSNDGDDWTNLREFTVTTASKDLFKPYSEFLVDNSISYKYYRILYHRNAANSPSRSERIGGFDLLEGWFDNELDERLYDVIWYDAVSAYDNFGNSDYPPENAIDGDVETEWEYTDENDSLTVELKGSLVVNFLEVIPRWGMDKRVYGLAFFLLGSNDNKTFYNIGPKYYWENTSSGVKKEARANFCTNSNTDGGGLEYRHTPGQTHYFDLTGVQTQPFKYYRIQWNAEAFSLSSGNTFLASLRLGYRGEFAYFTENLPQRYIVESDTNPMAICHFPEREASGGIGAVTSAEDDTEDYWRNRTSREIPEISGLTGAIAGEFEPYSEKHIIDEMPLEVQGLTAHRGYVEPEYKIDGLSGFGRQGYGDIRLEHEAEARIGENADLGINLRRYSGTGFCGHIAFLEIPNLGIDVRSYTGLLCSANLTYRQFAMESLSGAFLDLDRNSPQIQIKLYSGLLGRSSWIRLKRNISASSIHGVISGLNVSRRRFRISAAADVEKKSFGILTSSSRMCTGSSISGLSALLEAMRTAYRNQAQATVDSKGITSGFLPGYILNAKSSTDRFGSKEKLKTHDKLQDIILSYERPE